jgi:Flp pilus assembly protein TadG
MAALCGFCALVIDLGVLWIARGQAQNIADAAALAGATALAYDSVFTAATAHDAAIAVANLQPLWGQTAAVTVTVDSGSCSALPPQILPPPSGGRVLACVTANVYRDQAHGNPLPTVFGRAINVTTQGVRASAIATVAPANSSSCVWPLAIPDRWHESGPGGWVPTSTFSSTAPADTYVAPTTASQGDGYFMPTSLDVNVTLTLTQANFAVPISGQQFVPVRLPGASGSPSFATALSSCNGAPVSIGDSLAVDATGSSAVAASGASARIAADAAATWRSGATPPHIQASCAAANPPCATMTPRLVALPVFDVGLYDATRASGAPTIRVRNFAGFFISSVTGSAITGNLGTYHGDVMGDKVQAGLAVGYISALLRAPVLYR